MRILLVFFSDVGATCRATRDPPSVRVHVKTKHSAAAIQPPVRCTGVVDGGDKREAGPLADVPRRRGEFIALMMGGVRSFRSIL